MNLPTRNGPLSAALLFTSLGALLGACGPTANSVCEGRLAGDLVITEYMSDPEGTDTGREYIEVYNATAAAIELKGMTLYVSKADGSAQNTHSLTGGTIPSGGFRVLGDVRETALPRWIDYSYADDLGGLPNSAGLIGIRCGQTKLDEVRYTTAVKTATARVLTGGTTPDSTANDDETQWCNATGEYTAGHAGSPGLPNAPCSGSNAVCTLDTPGALVITEIMADAPSADEGKEWIEIFNTTGEPVDLAGLTLRFTRLDGSAKKETRLGEGSIAAGKYYTLGDVRDGNLPAYIDQSYGDALGALSNTDGKLTLLCGTTEIDSASYVGPGASVSRIFNGNAVPNATANDDPGAWCDSTAEYAMVPTTTGTAPAYGSPRALNEVCATVVTGCTDPVTQVSRSLNPPGPNRLIFTEVMPSPDTLQSDREWFELLALDDMDLNGVRIARGSLNGTSATRVTITSEQCIAVKAGTFLVLARKSDPSVNGGIAAPIHTFDFSLVDNDTLYASYSGTLIDKASYTDPGAKKSAQLSNNRLEAWVNDSAYAWCPGQGDYGSGTELGSPGTANYDCLSPVAPGECRDVGTGQPRVIDRPVAGELAFTEAMPAPTQTTSGTDRPKEWFEVLTLGSFDLNEVTFSNDSGTGTLFSIQQADCREVVSGSYLLFAQTASVADNGGLPTPNFVFDFDLTNSGTEVNPQRSVVARSGDLELDRFNWSNSTIGASRQLTSEVTASAGANDDPANLCDTPSGVTYGNGDRGTPGAANVACP